MAVGRATAGRRADGPLILAGFAEAMAAIETAWSLEGAGFKVAAFSRAGSRPALRRVRGVDVYEIPSPESDAIATVSAVQKLCDALAPVALLPLDDHAVWVCSRLEGAKVPLAGASGLAADFALDKSLQLQAAKQSGLPVPPTQVMDYLGEADPADFPVVVKPARAVYEIGGALERPTGAVCGNFQELRRAAARRWPGSVLIQPLIHGVGEGLFGHVGIHGATAWSAHRRIRMVNPQGSASSACRSEEVDKDLVEPSERFLNAIGWRGMFMLEFLRDAAGEPWFMELNGRTWGSMALARRRGFEYPAWTVRAKLDSSFEPTPLSQPPQVVCRNLGLELAHLAFVARGPQSEASTGWPTLGKAVRDVFKFSSDDRLYNWNRSEPAVLLTDTWATLRQYTRKMTGRRP
jgi:biotin carboxylase